MNREPKIAAQATSNTAASNRRLQVERLEPRSVLAAMLGLPESGPFHATAEHDGINTFNVSQFSGAADVAFTGTAHVGQFTLAHAADDQIADVNSQPVALQISDAMTWTTADPNSAILRPLDVASISKWTEIKTSEGSLPIIRQPGWGGKPIDIGEWNLPLKVFPWKVIDLGNISSDENVPDNSTNDPTPSSPTTSDPPTSSPPSLPIETQDGNDQDYDSSQTVSWFDSDATPKISSGESRSSALRAEHRTHDLVSHLTRSLVRSNLDHSELVETRDDHEQTVDKVFINELLELPVERSERSHAGNWRSDRRQSSPALAAPRTIITTAEIANFYRGQSSAIVPDVALPVTLSNDFANVFNEGGLVELVAIEASRIHANAKHSGNSAADLSTDLDATVDIFQAIDVASMVLEDPSQAAMAPIAFVIAFQLFNQRRRDVEADEEQRV